MPLRFSNLFRDPEAHGHLSFILKVVGLQITNSNFAVPVLHAKHTLVLQLLKLQLCIASLVSETHLASSSSKSELVSSSVVCEMCFDRL